MRPLARQQSDAFFGVLSQPEQKQLMALLKKLCRHHVTDLPQELMTAKSVASGRRVSARVVLISGANRGIGAAIADRLAAEGWGLSLGMRNPKAAPDRFKSQHVSFYDANQPGCEADWVSECAMERFGRIDAVINNAGVIDT